MSHTPRRPLYVVNADVSGTVEIDGVKPTRERLYTIPSMVIVHSHILRRTSTQFLVTACGQVRVDALDQSAAATIWRPPTSI